MEYREIVEIADRKNIKKEVIDKDWILGHFLNAMFAFPDISENFVFKGGTCLKKNYFDDYRFSEDLDFTLLNKAFVVDKLFFKKVIELAEQNSGAKFYLKNIKPQIHKDLPQGYEVIILYWGAIHKPNQIVLPVNRWQTKIKLDISFSEVLLLVPERKKIFHSYSDSETINNTVPVYPLNEVVAEKLRSLIQRNRPRDIYDLYYLSEIIKIDDYAAILDLLKQKSKSKNIDCCNYDDFLNQKKYKNNKRAWESSLEYHLPKGQLIEYDIAFSKVEHFVMNILKQIA
jgi:predicted nucleotidyltransferase component of viral defense system